MPCTVRVLSKANPEVAPLLHVMVAPHWRRPGTSEISYGLINETGRTVPPAFRCAAIRAFKTDWTSTLLSHVGNLVGIAFGAV